MPVEVKINKNQIELYAVGEDIRDIIKTHRNFYVGLRIKSGKNNIKKLLTSGSCEEGRYIIKSVMVEGNFFTSFEEVKKQFNINGQPKSIENTFEYYAKDLADLLETSKKEAQDNAAQLEEEKNAKITELKTAKEQVEEKDKQIKELNEQVQKLQAASNDTAAQLKAKDEKIKDLEAQLNNQPNAAQLKDKDKEITDLQTKLAEAEQDKNKALETAKKKAEEELRTKTQELQDQLDTAQQEKQNLEAEVEKLKAIDSTALQQQLEEKNAKITELEALDAVALQQKLTEKENEITALKAQPDAAVTKLEGEKTTLTNKIKDLEAQLSNRPDAAQLQVKDEKIKDLEAKINQPNAEVESLKKDLQAQNSQVQQLTQKNKELEAKNKTTEQPKQSNAARYTATVGMGLAAGLIAFTALEHTVRLEMLVMIGIAVASALVAGGITYAALPSTQVDETQAKNVAGGKAK